MRSHGIAVIKLAELGRVECDQPRGLAIQSQGHLAVFQSGHGSQVAIGDTEALVGCGELDAVSRCKFPIGLAEDVHALKAARIVDDS